MLQGSAVITKRLSPSIKLSMALATAALALVVGWQLKFAPRQQWQYVDCRDPYTLHESGDCNATNGYVRTDVGFRSLCQDEVSDQRPLYKRILDPNAPRPARKGEISDPYCRVIPNPE
jgi:hypothetical protein